MFDDDFMAGECNGYNIYQEDDDYSENEDESPSKKYISLYRKRYCPECTEVHHLLHDATYAGVSKNPVFLVRRVNKKTNDWFYGCPNFPKCKYSENRPKTPKEINLETWAWANAQCGPHY